MCSESCMNSITNVSRLDLAVNLSDHHPLEFCFQVSCALPHVSSPSYMLHHTNVPKFNWASASPSDLNKFRDLVENSLPKLTDAASACCEPTCDVHQSSLDEFCNQWSACLLDSASASIPMYHNSGHTRIAGWNDSARPLKDKANFWHKVWIEAGCPSAGVLAEIKKAAKTRYKYAVRRLKRRQTYIKRKKMGEAFASRNVRNFWNEVKKINKKSRSCPAQLIYRWCLVIMVLQTFGHPSSKVYSAPRVLVLVMIFMLR